MKRQVRDAIEFFDADMATCTDPLAVHHWQTLKSAVLVQLSHNKPNMPVCSNAIVNWMVCSCSIKSDVAPDMDSCDGKGAYGVTKNCGYKYSYQCNKVPGKPA
jgi:hypothetical protein